MKKRYVWLAVGLMALATIVGGGVALWNYHEQPQFCAAACHVMQPYLDSWQSSTPLAHAHAQADVTCLQCHEPNIQQQVTEVVHYVTGNYRTPLKERQFSDDFCLRCHGTREQLVEATQDYVAADGTSVNPHARTVDWSNPESPHESGTGTVECYRCHKMHQDVAPLEYCYGCHHERTFEKCSDSGCHDEATDSSSNGGF
jgi:cytochrome c nitrite reductase small subunit